MNFKVTNKLTLANNTKRLDILAPAIAKKVKPGQFVSIVIGEGDERIPLTVIDQDLKKGTITIIFKEAGDSTKKLGELSINDDIQTILGPLGRPSTIEKVGRIVCITSGIGTAQILPICRALKNVGNKVVGIVGARTRRSMMVEAQMRLTCDKLFCTTEDGSYERKGVVTDVLTEVLERNEVNLIYCIGSAEMMEAVSQMSRDKKIKTIVHLNPIMVDCMGMCGSCRVKVDGKYVLGCIDGPEFDGHLVDFKDYKIRLNAFEETEEWRKHRLQPKTKTNETKTFKRFLSGILRN